MTHWNRALVIIGIIILITMYAFIFWGAFNCLSMLVNEQHIQTSIHSIF